MVYPKERTISFVGDLDLLDADVEFYNADEKTYRDNKAQQGKYRHTQHGVLFPVITSADDRSIFHKRQFGTRFSFHNYSNHDILIIDRINLPVTITPDANYIEGPPRLIIRKELYFDTQEIATKAYQNVASFSTIHGNELTKILPHLGKQIQHSLFGRCIALEYTVLFSEIVQADGELFHIPTDTLLSILPIQQTNKHPASPEYVNSKLQYPSTYPSTENDVGVIFRYISNCAKATPKYIRVGNKVFKILPQSFNPAKLMEVTLKDRSVVLEEASEYIECLYPTKIDALRNTTTGYRCNRLSLNEAKEKYGIFDSLEEANAPLLAIEKAEQRLRDKIEQLELDQKQLQREHRDKLRNLENEIKAKQSDYDDLKKSKQAQTEKQKDLNDQAAHQRKSHFEFFKFILGSITAVLAMIPILLKLRQAK